MDSEEFINKINKAQDLIAQEKLTESLEILYDLREIEKKGNFDYSLTHSLYQLISNSESLLNQKNILDAIESLANQRNSISFSELNQYLKNKFDYKLDYGILKREIELLILRDKINYKLEGNELIF